MDSTPAKASLSTADSQRFMRLFLGAERRIYAFILASVLHPADADDVMQEATAVMLAKFDQFEPDTDFGAWAMQITWYEILKFRQRRARRATVSFSDESLGLIADHMTTHAAAMNTRQEALRTCLSQLSESDRRLIELRYEQDATTKETAVRAGRSVQAVYKALNRIHHFLLMCIRRRIAAGADGAGGVRHDRHFP